MMLSMVLIAPNKLQKNVDKSDFYLISSKNASAQLVATLRTFDSQWSHWDFSLT